MMSIPLHGLEGTATCMVQWLFCKHVDELDAKVFRLMKDWLQGLSPMQRDLFLLKPNLVSDYPPPITTPIDIVEAVIKAIIAVWPRASIAVGEGTASIKKDTWQVYEALGYMALAHRYHVELVDLNESPLVLLKDDKNSFFPEIWLPEVAMKATLISIPVLKAHTLAGVTLSMKNMIGLLPPRHYQESGHWKKSICHRAIHRAIYEINRYRSPDFTLLDARRGMAQSHLGGPELDPAPGAIVCGDRAWEVDARGATLVGKDWRAIDHIYWSSKEGGEVGS